jgi:hypothetical protein
MFARASARARADSNSSEQEIRKIHIFDAIVRALRAI